MGNSDSKGQEFLDACYAGKIDEVERLITSEKVPVHDVTDHRGRHPLPGAVLSGVQDLVDYLLQHQVDVNKGQEGEGTPLYLACREHMADLALTLLATGEAEVDRGARDGTSALHAAAARGHAEIARFLVLQGKADVGLLARDGRGPLHAAAAAGAVEILDVLAAAGADLRQVTAPWAGRSAAHVAAAAGHTAFLRALQERGALDADAGDDYGYPPLTYAARGGHLGAAEFLVKEAGADPLVWGWDRATPLAAAAAAGRDDVCEFLLGLGSGGGGGGGGGGEGAAGAGLRTLFLRSPAALYRAQAGGSPGPFVGAAADPFAGEEEEKGAAGGAPGALLAQWEQEVAKLNPAVGRAGVRLVPAARVLEAAALPSFAECAERGWHVTLDAVPEGAKVLYVAHRWGPGGAADPTGLQHKTLCRFLRKGGAFDFVWLDRACLAHAAAAAAGPGTAAAAAARAAELANVTTALFAAAAVLFLPQTKEVVAGPPGEDGAAAAPVAPVSANSELFAGRAWLSVEVALAALAEREMAVAFQAGDHVHFARVRPGQAGGGLGVEACAAEGLRELQARDGHFLDTVNRAEVLEAYAMFENARGVSLAVDLCQEQSPALRRDLFKCHALRLDQADVDRHPKLGELLGALGEADRPGDALLALNLLLQACTFVVGRWELAEEEAARRREAQARAAEAAQAQAQEAAATHMQRLARGFTRRKAAEKQKEASTQIGRHARGHVARRRARELAAQKHGAATSLQRLFRGSQSRKEVAQVKEQKHRAATGVQSLFRGKQAREATASRKAAAAERAAEEQQGEAATHIQRLARGKLGRKASVRQRQQKAEAEYAAQSADLITGGEDLLGGGGGGGESAQAPETGAATGDDPFGNQDITHLLQAAPQEEQQQSPSEPTKEETKKKPVPKEDKKTKKNQDSSQEESKVEVDDGRNDVAMQETMCMCCKTM